MPKEEAWHSPTVLDENVSVSAVRLPLSPAPVVARCRAPREERLVVRKNVVALVDLAETWRCRSTRTADDRLDDYPE